MKWKHPNETLWTCGVWSIEHMAHATRPLFELWEDLEAPEELQRMGTKCLHKFVCAVDTLDEAKAAAAKRTQ